LFGVDFDLRLRPALRSAPVERPPRALVLRVEREVKLLLGKRLNLRHFLNEYSGKFPSCDKDSKIVQHRDRVSTRVLSSWFQVPTKEDARLCRSVEFTELLGSGFAGEEIASGPKG
jgi:hypothetical protein